MPRPSGAQPRQAEQTRDERDRNRDPDPDPDPDWDPGSAPLGRRLPPALRARRGRPRDPVERPSLDHRRVLLRPHEERLLDEHQGAARPLGVDHGHPRPARRPVRAVPPPPHRVDERAHGERAREVRGRPSRRRPLRGQRSVRRGRHPSPGREPRPPRLQRRHPRRFRLQHRPPRRHRRHGPGEHGGRDDGDLPGRAPDPRGAALPARRAPAGSPRPPAPQRAGPPRAARRLLRPDRGLPARRPPAARARRGAGRDHGDARVRAHDGTLRTAPPERHRDRPGRDLRVRGPARQRRHGPFRPSHPGPDRGGRATASASTSRAPRSRCRGT